MSQIQIFISQFGEITLVQRLLLVILRHRLQFQQSSLSHEHRLYLEEVIPMMAHSTERYVLCPLFKHVAIDAEAIVSGQRHEVAVLPRTITSLYALSDGLRLLFQSFRLQSRHPGMHSQSRQFRNHLITRRIAVSLLQFVVVRPHMFRHVELHLFDILPVGVHHLRIQYASHVQNHVVVTLILIMAMQIPVARFVVDLHVTHPQRPPDSHLRIEEVRARIAVVQPRVDHFNGLAIASPQFPQGEQLVFEHIMQ